ncbi:nucleotidyltransferase family protein [Lysobacter gummosus]|uniref:nucleotidyltransferase family protein n=1 Tax=Lysobacter gummosus TaxID=262324 RepID=UPI003635398A
MTLKSYLHYALIVNTWAEAKPVINRAWIFGSYAAGQARLDSDLDVAIEIATEATRKYGIKAFWFDHHTDFQEQLQALAAEVPVQLEMYHRYHGGIVYRAINSNCIRPVYKRPRGRHVDPVSRISKKLRNLAGPL